MASTPSPSSCALIVSRPPLSRLHSPSPKFLSPLKSRNPVKIPQLRRRANRQRVDVKTEFDLSFFDSDLDEEEGELPGWSIPAEKAEEEPEPECPPGLRKYETMVVLRPDMSEDERLACTQKYEELLVAGGGMYVEVFNRGVIPLGYDIRKINTAGERNIYMDGIYLLFTYFTKPESMSILGETLLADDDVIRSSSFKIKKRKKPVRDVAYDDYD